MRDGIYQGLSFEEYCKCDGVNASLLKQFDRSPAHGQSYLRGLANEETDSMSFGVLAHRFALEPEKALNHLVCRPIVNGVEMDFRGKEGRAWRDAQLALGHRITTEQERKDIVGVVNAICTHPIARKLIDKSQSEVSLFADWEQKVQRKCRIDLLPEGNAIGDIKTTQDARPHAFARQMAALKYGLQGTYYMDICNALGMDKQVFLFIAVESTAPYNVAVYQLDRTDVEASRNHYRRLLDQFVDCLHTDNWPGYPTDIQTISMPAWARKNEEEAA